MIRRKLMHASWEYDQDNQTLNLETEQGNIKLNRAYAFSLARFLIRVFFRMSMKHRKVKEVEQNENINS